MDDLVSITTQNIHKIVFKTASVCFKLWTNFEPGDGVLSSYNFNTTSSRNKIQTLTRRYAKNL